MKTLALIILSVAAAAGVWYFQPPIPQDPAYHLFADTRPMYGIENFWNVASSGLIALVGLLGLARSSRMSELHMYGDFRREFGVVFTAALLTGLGSMWYHLAPGNASLVLDRLPMSIIFTAVLGIVISLYISELVGKLLFWPLVLAGVASVIYWHQTETAGAGDLRFYILTQYLSAVLILLIIILYRGMQRPGALLGAALLFYVIAKAGEYFDGMVYQYTNELVSGHTIKHTAAALALFMVYLILRRRHA